MLLTLSASYTLDVSSANAAQLKLLTKAIEKCDSDSKMAGLLDPRNNPVTCSWLNEPLFKIGNLVSYLQRMDPNRQTYTLNYITSHSKSMIKILPLLPKTLLSENQNATFHYLNALIDKSLFNQKKWEAYPVLPTQITQSDAIKAVLCSSQARNDLEFRAVHLKDSETIVIYCEAFCFYITYGNNADIGYLGPVIFNLQKGFLLESLNQHRQIILDALQAHFSQWKDNGYAGDLFPAEMALPQMGPKPIKPMPDLIKDNMSAFSEALKEYVNTVQKAALDFPEDESMAPDDIQCAIMSSVCRFPVMLHGGKYDLESLLKIGTDQQGKRANPLTRHLFSILEVNADWNTFEKVKTWCSPKAQAAPSSTQPSLVGNPNTFITGSAASSANNGSTLPAKRYFG